MLLPLVAKRALRTEKIKKLRSISFKKILKMLVIFGKSEKQNVKRKRQHKAISVTSFFTNQATPQNRNASKLGTPQMLVVCGEEEQPNAKAMLFGTLSQKRAKVQVVTTIGGEMKNAAAKEDLSQSEQVDNKDMSRRWS